MQQSHMALGLSGNQSNIMKYEYRVLEQNKVTGEIKVLASFDSLEEAEPYWKAIAFKYIDYYELWHRVEKVSVHN